MATRVPATKNGPKGTSDLKDFLWAKTSPTPIVAPEKKAKNKATKIFGQPRINPIRKASLISPAPIHLPRDASTIRRKNPEAPIADIRRFQFVKRSNLSK